MNLLKRFVYEEDGLGTVELVLILAALVSIALIFKKQIVSFVNDHVGGIFDKAEAGVTIEDGTPSAGEAAPE